MQIWGIISTSFNYVGTMEGAFPVCLNWSNVETLLRLYKIKPYRMLVKKIRLAESLTIKQANESNKKG